MSGIRIAKGKDRSTRIELFANIRRKGDRLRGGRSSSKRAGITRARVYARTSGPVLALLTDFTRFFERGGGTDRCKFSRNKRNRRRFGCNLDSTQGPRLPRWTCTRHEPSSLFRRIYSSEIRNVYIISKLQYFRSNQNKKKYIICLSLSR